MTELGWKIAVVTCTNNPWEPADAELSERVPPGVEVHGLDYRATWRSRLIHSKLGRRVGLWDRMTIWTGEVKPLVAGVLREFAPEVVLTSGPPHSVHMLGRWAKRRKEIVWAADFRDPWIVGNWYGPPASVLARRRERSLVAAADLVVANAPQARQAYCEHYPEWRSKFVSITNGFDAERLAAQGLSGQQLPGQQMPGKQLRSGRPIRLLHAGEIYAGRDPRSLLDALAGMPKQADRVEIEFVGRSEIDLVEEARQRDLGERVCCRGQVPASEVKRSIDEADVLVLMDTPGRRIGVPAKLYEYIGSGRPVLALAERDSDTAWALRESGIRHAIAPPQNVEAISAALAKVVELAGRAGLRFARGSGSVQPRQHCPAAVGSTSTNPGGGGVGRLSGSSCVERGARAIETRRS